MNLFVTCDADGETGLHEIVRELNRSPMKDFFTDRFYDDSRIEMAMILMGRDPRWNFKQRIRFVKKENCLYIDLMFDWNKLVYSERATRRRIVAEKFLAEFPEIIGRYKSKRKYGFKDFDLPRFTKDLREWFETHGWVDSDFPEEIET